MLKVLMAMVKTVARDLRVRSYIRSRWPKTILEPRVHIKGPLKNLQLSDDVQLQSGTVLHLGGMPWCENAGRITIESGSVISPNCTLYGSGSGGIIIGKRFDCGPGVGIFSSRTDYLRGPGHHLFAPVRIGDDVTIFANAVISPGVSIGTGAVIAAGAIVTEDVPENCLVGGMPAKMIRNLSHDPYRHKEAVS